MHMLVTLQSRCNLLISLLTHNCARLAAQTGELSWLLLAHCLFLAWLSTALHRDPATQKVMQLSLPLQMMAQLQATHRPPMASELSPQKLQSPQPTPQKPSLNTAPLHPPHPISHQMPVWPHKPYLQCKQPLLMSLMGKAAPAAARQHQLHRSRPHLRAQCTAWKAMLSLTLRQMLPQQVTSCCHCRHLASSTLPFTCI